jgi:hypothetical protein
VNRQQRRAAERTAAKNGTPVLPSDVRPAELGVEAEHVGIQPLPLLPESPPGGAVVVGWLSGGMCHHEFLLSMLDLQDYDSRGDRWLSRPGGGRIGIQSGPRVAEGRHKLVEHFLTNPEFEQAEWLLMLDDDMAFDADLLHKLMNVASYPERPIIGGLCFAGRHYGKQWPTIYEMYQDDDSWGVRPVMDYPDDTLVKCGATGAACLLVHRQVYLGIANAPWNKTLPGGRENPYPWFVEGLVTHDNTPLGEDIAFCKKAVLCDIPIHVHTGIKLGHLKVAPLSDRTFRGQLGDENEAIARKLGTGEFELVPA